MPNATTPDALVVDDDGLILMDACDILERAGFHCHDATNADEAIELLREHAGAITLLFSDVDMPGSMNGFALARHVDQHWPHIEIVIASGHVLPNTDEMPDKATFIAKPFSALTVSEHLASKLPDEKKPEPLKHVER